MADVITDNMPKIKSTVTPVLTSVCNVLKFVIENFRGLISISTAVVSGFVAFKVISNVVALYKALTIAINGAKTATAVLNAVMASNPIGLIAVGIGSLIGLLTYLELKFKLVTKSVQKFKEVAKNIGSYVVERVERGNSSKNISSKPDKPINKYASGTLYAHGGKAVINEKGAELVELPEGSKVMTANATKQIMNGGNCTINLNIAGNVIGNNEFIRQISNTLGRQLVTAMSC